MSFRLTTALATLSSLVWALGCSPEVSDDETESSTGSTGSAGPTGSPESDSDDDTSAPEPEDTSAPEPEPGSSGSSSGGSSGDEEGSVDEVRGLAACGFQPSCEQIEVHSGLHPASAVECGARLVTLERAGVLEYVEYPTSLGDDPPPARRHLIVLLGDGRAVVERVSADGAGQQELCTLETAPHDPSDPCHPQCEGDCGCGWSPMSVRDDCTPVEPWTCEEVEAQFAQPSVVANEPACACIYGEARNWCAYVESCGTIRVEHPSASEFGDFEPITDEERAQSLAAVECFVEAATQGQQGRLELFEDDGYGFYDRRLSLVVEPDGSLLRWGTQLEDLAIHDLALRHISAQDDIVACGSEAGLEAQFACLLALGDTVTDQTTVCLDYAHDFEE